MRISSGSDAFLVEDDVMRLVEGRPRKDHDVYHLNYD